MEPVNKPGLARAVSSPVPLRDRLDRRSSRERYDALLAAPDTEAVVARTDALELYEIIHDIGLRDAMDLARLATPQQLQTFADLDCWQRDQFVSARLEPWLELYLQLDDEPFEQLYQELDPEILPLFLQEHLRVHLPDEDGNAPEIVPDEETRPLEQSPCNTYWIQYPEDEASARLCRALVRRIYAVLGIEKGWLMLESGRWELASQMEETAFHFRSARLEDYGFRRFDEAIEVYAAIDPAAVRRELVALVEARAVPGAVTVGGSWAPDNGLHLPRSLLARLSASEEDDSEEAKRVRSRFLEQCLSGLDSETWRRVEQQLLVLANMAASADAVDPSDREAVAEHFARSAGVLGIGLEFVAERQVERGALALAELPVRQLFQVGHALLMRLQAQARELVERGNVTLTGAPASLVSSDEQDQLDGLLLKRPLRSALDATPFVAHSELEEAARTLASIAFREMLVVGVLGIRREALEAVAAIPQLVGGAEAMSFEKVFATVVLNKHLGREPLQPFAPRELPRDAAIIEAAFAGFDESRLVSADHPGASAVRAAALRFAAGAARSVLDELTGEGELDPRFIGSVLVLDTDAVD